MKDSFTPYALAVAGFACAFYFLNLNSQLFDRSNSCELQFEAFKEGVLYVR
jgi:hypothetical protein